MHALVGCLHMVCQTQSVRCWATFNLFVEVIVWYCIAVMTKWLLQFSYLICCCWHFVRGELLHSFLVRPVSLYYVSFCDKIARLVYFYFPNAVHHVPQNDHGFPECKCALVSFNDCSGFMVVNYMRNVQIAILIILSNTNTL